MRKHRHLPFVALFFFMFIFSVFIAWNIPYTHDDWDWGRPVGITNWLSGFYNNRYVGTFFVITMTRSPILKTLMMSFVMTCLPLLCTYLGSTVDCNHPSRLYVCVLLYFVVFAMPVTTWQQTYGWISSFSNFTMGAFLLLLLLSILKSTICTGTRHYRARSICCFFLGLSAEFCAENMSIFCPFLLAGAMLLLRVWKHKDQRMVFFATLAGTILGAALMFFNPLYLKLATTGVAQDQFRSLIFTPGDPIGRILRILLSRCFKEILPSLYETHPILVLYLAIGAWIDLKSRRRTAAICICLPMVLYGISCFCAVSIFQTVEQIPGTALLRPAGAFLFTGLWLLSVLLSPCQSKYHKLIFSLFAFALTTPFVVINLNEPRLYHISHFCLLITGAFNYEHVDFKFPVKVMTSAALTLTVVCLVQAYATIGACNSLRQELTQEALQTHSDTLVLPSVGERYRYFWGYNPQMEVRADHYREFYGLPEDLDLVFLPYGSFECWPDIPDYMYEAAVVYSG